MMLVLQCGLKKFKLSQPVIIGRKDFPSQNLMSRQHFEVRITNEGRIYVTDLGSVNGTSLRGAKLKPNVSIELTPTDELLAGGLTFMLAQTKTLPIEKRHVAGVGIFAMMLLTLIATPTMAGGRAVGFSGFIIVLSTLLVPFALSMAFFEYLTRFQKWPKVAWKFALAVFVATAVLNDLAVDAVDSSTNARFVLQENKIRYYCLTKFQPDTCVREINLCPKCPSRIGNLDRQLITDRLRAFYGQPAPVDKAPASVGEPYIPTPIHGYTPTVKPVKAAPVTRATTRAKPNRKK